MNDYQRHLYQDLLSLTQKHGNYFYMKKVYLDESVYVIFDYSNAVPYEYFLLPSALECRGIMFQMEGSKPIRLTSFPMAKFFNLHENPLTQNIDLTTVRCIEVKADGSLVSTFLHNNQTLRFKSKSAIDSQQCIDSMAWLEQHADLHQAMEYLEQAGYTINAEWCAPDNRVFVHYNEAHLRVLNVRCRTTGQYLNVFDASSHANDKGLRNALAVIRDFFIDRVDFDDPADFVNQISHQVGVEGYVLHLSNGQRIKVKTDWYRSRLHFQTALPDDAALFVLCVQGQSDDLRAHYHDNLPALQRITTMEQVAREVVQTTQECVETFYEQHGHLNPKQYRRAAGKQLTDVLQGLANHLYAGRLVDYEAVVVKHAKKFVRKRAWHEVKRVKSG